MEIKRNLKLGILVAIFSLVAGMNHTFHVLTANEKLSKFIDRGAMFIILAYILYITISSYISIKDRRE